MRREYRNGRWEVLVDTPIGPQWQAETADRPRLPSNPYARYDPSGRQAGVPASVYRRPATQEEELFGDEFGSLIGDALGGNQKPVGSGGKRGGGRKPYAKTPPMAPWVSGAQSPLYLEQLRKKRYA